MYYEHKILYAHRTLFKYKIFSSARKVSNICVWIGSNAIVVKQVSPLKYDKYYSHIPPNMKLHISSLFSFVKKKQIYTAIFFHYKNNNCSFFVYLYQN